MCSNRGALRRIGYKSNVAPREQLALAEKEGKISPRLIEKLKRREAAHANALEGLGPFLGGLVRCRPRKSLIPRLLATPLACLPGG